MHVTRGVITWSEVLVIKIQSTVPAFQITDKHSKLGMLYQSILSTRRTWQASVGDKGGKEYCRHFGDKPHRSDCLLCILLGVALLFKRA